MYKVRVNEIRLALRVTPNGIKNLLLSVSVSFGAPFRTIRSQHLEVHMAF